MRVYRERVLFLEFWVREKQSMRTFRDFSRKFYHVSVMHHLCHVCLVEPDDGDRAGRVFEHGLAHRHLGLERFLDLELRDASIERDSVADASIADEFDLAHVRIADREVKQHVADGQKSQPGESLALGFENAEVFYERV